MRRLLPALLLGLLCMGCGGRYANGVFKNRDVTYAIAALDSSWEYKKDKASDVRFEHVDTGATIYSLSTCRGFQDAPLTVLSNHLFFGFDDRDVRQQRLFRLDNREALERVVLGRLDGSEVGLALTVLKKNACVFDFSLVAEPEDFEQLLEEYRGFVESFALDPETGVDGTR